MNFKDAMGSTLTAVDTMSYSRVDPIATRHSYKMPS